MDHVLVDSAANFLVECHFFLFFQDRLINLQVSECFMINLKIQSFRLRKLIFIYSNIVPFAVSLKHC